MNQNSNGSRHSDDEDLSTIPTLETSSTSHIQQRWEESSPSTRDTHGEHSEQLAKEELQRSPLPAPPLRQPSEHSDVRTGSYSTKNAKEEMQASSLPTPPLRQPSNHSEVQSSSTMFEASTISSKSSSLTAEDRPPLHSRMQRSETMKDSQHESIREDEEYGEVDERGDATLSKEQAIAIRMMQQAANTANTSSTPRKEAKSSQDATKKLDPSDPRVASVVSDPQSLAEWKLNSTASQSSHQAAGKNQQQNLSSPPRQAELVTRKMTPVPERDVDVENPQQLPSLHDRLMDSKRRDSSILPSSSSVSHRSPSSILPIPSTISETHSGNEIPPADDLHEHIMLSKRREGETGRAEFRDLRYSNTRPNGISSDALTGHRNLAEDDAGPLNERRGNLDEDFDAPLQDQPSQENSNEAGDESSFTRQIASMLERPGAFAVGQTRVRSRRRGMVHEGSNNSSDFSAYRHTNSFDTLPQLSPRNSNRTIDSRSASHRAVPSGLTSPSATSIMNADLEESPNCSTEPISRLERESFKGGEVFQKEDEEKKPSRKFYYVAAAVLMVILVSGLLVGLVVLRSDDTFDMTTIPSGAPVALVQPTASPSTPSPTSLERLEDFREVLISISDAELLGNPDSSQYKALNWLANEDPAFLDVSIESTETVQERYMAALIYFSIRADTLSQDHPMNRVMNSGRHICDWEFFWGNVDNSDERWESDPLGIVCDTGPSDSTGFVSGSSSRRRVTEIVIKRLGAASDGTPVALGGEIPTEICAISFLQKIILNQISLQGTIPLELGTCSNLEEIDLGLNELSGSIPSSFGMLTVAQNIRMSRNNLSQRIPTELGLLSDSLLSLSLDSNQLEDMIPSTLFLLTNLHHLDLSENIRLSGSIPPDIGNLVLLETLMLRLASLRGSIPSQLGALVNLSTIDLSQNALEGTIPTELASLDNLKVIDFELNFLSGTIPSLLGRDNLGVIRLRSNSLTGSMVDICDSNPGVSACADCSEPGVGVLCPCCAEQNCCSFTR